MADLGDRPDLTPDMFDAVFKAKMIHAYPVISQMSDDEAFYSTGAERDEAFARILASRNLRPTCELELGHPVTSGDRPEGHGQRPTDVYRQGNASDNGKGSNLPPAPLTKEPSE